MKWRDQELGRKKRTGGPRRKRRVPKGIMSRSKALCNIGGRKTVQVKKRGRGRRDGKKRSRGGEEVKSFWTLTTEITRLLAGKSVRSNGVASWGGGKKRCGKRRSENRGIGGCIKTFGEVGKADRKPRERGGISLMKKNKEKK